jgi:hypothetical protein
MTPFCCKNREFRLKWTIGPSSTSAKPTKKAFVFDEGYRIVFEKTTQLPETTDDDGDPCEGLNLLTKWVLETWREILNDEQFNILAANATTCGTSLVHLGEDGKPVLPLYNYLKPFPENLKKQFFDTYGSEEKISLETASPSLGSLNSGLQLYRLKYEKPTDFPKMKFLRICSPPVSRKWKSSRRKSRRLPRSVLRWRFIAIGTKNRYPTTSFL